MHFESLSPAGARRNRFSSAFPSYTSTPNGYLAPMAFVLPKISGGMATNNQVQITVAQSSATLVNAQYMVGSSTITVALTSANLGQIFAGLAAGTITVAQATADLSALVAAEGSSTITVAVSSAVLGGKFSMGATSTIVVTPTGLLTAIAHMEASAGGATPLSPEGLALSLLDGEEIETGYSLRESLRLILSSLAGKVSGAGTSTISIRDVNDSIDRIIATVDSNGNRTVVTKDVS